MTVTQTIRLALLICDTPIGPILEKDGDYHWIFGDWLRKTSPVGLEFTLDAFDVVKKMEYPPDGVEYDGIILTGSAASAYQDVEWINKLVGYTSNLAQSKPGVKIFAICFGHQIVGRAFGETCVLNSRWDVGIANVQLTDIGQRILDTNTSSLNIQKMNRDHVPTVPPGFELLASTDLCPNEGMVRYTADESGKLAKLSDIQILTMQGHPEYSTSNVELVVGYRAEMGILTPECARDAIERNKRTNEAPEVVSRAVWKVLGVTPAGVQNTGGGA